MNCKDYQELLDAYLDRELSAEDQKAVGGHLDQCAVCKSEASALLALKGNVRRVALPPMPEDVRAQIEAQTIFRPRFWEHVRPWMWPTVAAAAALGMWALLHLKENVNLRQPQSLPVAVLPVPQRPAGAPAAMVAWNADNDSDTTRDLQ